MNEQIVLRLKRLRAEYEAGQKLLVDLDARRTTLNQTLLRIEGAIQVLCEITEHESSALNGAADDTAGIAAPVG